ncbi:potassium-transporting ATPase subunit F [Erysipelotrichaceae bacterium AF15-26LB]|nr:potassium-transporting ATPase subunit F [[Clostridium] innocuum]RJV89955.1 potassium-transporting ATPase subunit F [Erysipelotrichaceae bacterium AF19-24AC]RJV90502.1 potassium-transporting ATPase subunit F [Erysipelotrichaceae bacterium AF15-26LB]
MEMIVIVFYGVAIVLLAYLFYVLFKGENI